MLGDPERSDGDVVELTNPIIGSHRRLVVRDAVLVSSDLGRHAAWLHELSELGWDSIYLHHVGRDQRAFIEAFGEHVLPELADRVR